MRGPAPHHSYNKYWQLRTFSPYFGCDQVGPEPLVEYHFDLLILHFGLLPTDLAASGCALASRGPARGSPRPGGSGLPPRPRRRGPSDMRRTHAIHSQKRRRGIIESVQLVRLDGRIRSTIRRDNCPSTAVSLSIEASRSSALQYSRLNLAHESEPV